MLTKDDLLAIGQVIEERVPAIVGKVVDERLNDPQGILNIKLDAMQEQLEGVEAKVDRLEVKVDSVENRMVTLEKLERYEVGQTERYDKRYARLNPAS